MYWSTALWCALSCAHCWAFIVTLAGLLLVLHGPVLHHFSVKWHIWPVTLLTDCSKVTILQCTGTDQKGASFSVELIVLLQKGKASGGGKEGSISFQVCEVVPITVQNAERVTVLGIMPAWAFWVQTRARCLNICLNFLFEFSSQRRTGIVRRFIYVIA